MRPRQKEKKAQSLKAKLLAAKNQRWKPDNENDTWNIINKTLAKKGHRLFKGLYKILENEYRNNPDLVKTEQSKFIQAMVFRLANTPLLEQKSEFKTAETKVDETHFAEFFQPTKNPLPRPALSKRQPRMFSAPEPTPPEVDHKKETKSTAKKQNELKRSG